MKGFLLTLVMLLSISLPTALILNLNNSSNLTSVEKVKPVMDLELPETEDLKTDASNIKIRNADMTINLESKNTLIMRGPVTAKSVTELQSKAMAMSLALSKKTPIYLVMDTPGGSVFAGLELIDYLRAIPQKVNTITLFAASMGFQIVQNMDERYITNQGTLMSHRAALGGLGGQLDGEFETRYKMIKRKTDYMDAIAAKRMGMSVKDYKAMILNEYWVHGFDSVGDRAADKIINLTCGKSLSGTNNQTINTLFGEVEVEFSECPLIRGPLKVKFNGIASKDRSKVQDAVNKALTDKRQYVKEYILTNKFTEIFGH